jgi:hypothetical protein
MKKYLIRFNKSKGLPGRGTPEHAWRIFEDETEYLVKHLKINVPSFDETISDGQGHDDWNIGCFGVLVLDKETSTAIINRE